MTRGTFHRPLEKASTFAAWFRMASIATAMKSTNITSTTGFKPAIAAATAAPTNAPSLMGVFNTRFVPKREKRFTRMSSTSSPMTIMRSSALMACASALSIACAKLRVFIWMRPRFFGLQSLMSCERPSVFRLSRPVPTSVVSLFQRPISCGPV